LREFFSTLFVEASASDLNGFSNEDRAFIAAMMRKTGDGKLDIPVLPEAALRIQVLLAQPNVGVDQLTEVFRTDPALSAEMLKVANSAYYGFPSPTHDLWHAIQRVGFNQTMAIVVMAALRSKVLQSRAFHCEVEWVTDLAMSTAHACHGLSSELQIAPEEGFTRGLLCHIDYFAILGMAADYSSRQKTPVSRRALAEVMRRLGPDVTSQIALHWELPVLGRTEAAKESALLHRQVEQVATALALTWSGLETDYAVEGLDSEVVSQIVEHAIFNAPA
jgi:HD-like signal output (HDOD) protein